VAAISGIVRFSGMNSVRDKAGRNRVGLYTLRKCIAHRKTLLLEAMEIGRSVFVAIPQKNSKGERVETREERSKGS